MTSSALGAVLDSEGGTVNFSEADPGESILDRIRREKQVNPRYQADLLEVAGLYTRVLNGERNAITTFVEAMTRSDFATLFGDVVDRQLYAKYVSKRSDWRSYAHRTVVSDFKTVKRFAIDGAEGILSAVPERAPYPSAPLTDSSYSFTVSKFGRVIGLSWEAIVNDDMGAFRDLPERLANAAIRSEDKFVTDLYANAGGPDSTFFSTGNKNILTAGATSALSLDSLQSAYTLLSEQVDTDGGPIYVDSVVLVVPPALEVAARNIINGIQINVAVGSGGASTDATRTNQLVAANWMANKTALVVNPMLPLVSTTGTFGKTAWYMFANPNMGRPALEVGFLRGRETPDIRMKSPDSVRPGGGTVDPMEGDFETDQVMWRVRHVYGGVLVDPKVAVASPGQ